MLRKKVLFSCQFFWFVGCINEQCVQFTKKKNKNKSTHVRLAYITPSAKWNFGRSVMYHIILLLYHVNLRQPHPAATRVSDLVVPPSLHCFMIQLSCLVLPVHFVHNVAICTWFLRDVLRARWGRVQTLV